MCNIAKDCLQYFCNWKIPLWLRVSASSYCDHRDLNPSNAYRGYFRPKRKNGKMFENHINPVMFVLSGKLLMSSLRWVPNLPGFQSFSDFLHHFAMTKLATSTIMVNPYNQRNNVDSQKFVWSKFCEFTEKIFLRFFIFANRLLTIYIRNNWDWASGVHKHA